MKKLTVYLVISVVLFVAASCKEQQEPLETSDPNQCPAGRFTTEATPASGIRTFVAEPQENAILCHWYINDTLVGSSDNRTFAYDFWTVLDGSVPGGAGEYEICLRTLTPDCPEGTTPFCETVTVASPNVCPEVSLTAQNIQPTIFTLTSSLDAKDALYYWYIDSVAVDTTTLSQWAYDFTLGSGKPTQSGPGNYEVCLEVVIPECPEGTEFACELLEIAAAANCPSANFTTEQNSSDRFTFTADFEERALYYWYINGILAGDTGSSSFSYDFLSDPDAATGGGPGDYDICLRVVTPDCHQGSELFCEKITVESTS